MNKTLRLALVFGIPAICVAMTMYLPPEVHAASPVVTTPIAMNGCELVCSENPCPEDQHDAWEPESVTPFAMRNGGDHPYGVCFSGTCDTKHGPLPCSPEWGEPVDAAALEQLRSAVFGGNSRVVNQLLTEHAKQITLNTSRAAIQVKNCFGVVFVHMPVSSELLSSLTAANH